jgi:hypothetical protein
LTTIFVVTHGDRYYGSEYPDPSHTPAGHEEIRRLKPLLPQMISVVIAGTGKRFYEIAEDLELKPTRFSTVIGCGDAISQDGENIVLSWGKIVPKKAYTTRKDMGTAHLKLIQGLPTNSVICAGRPFVKQLGVEKAKSGCLYTVEYEPTEVKYHIFEITKYGKIHCGEFPF